MPCGNNCNDNCISWLKRKHFDFMGSGMWPVTTTAMIAEIFCGLKVTELFTDGRYFYFPHIMAYEMNTVENDSQTCWRRITPKSWGATNSCGLTRQNTPAFAIKHIGGIMSFLSCKTNIYPSTKTDLRRLAVHDFLWCFIYIVNQLCFSFHDCVKCQCSNIAINMK